MALKGDRKSLPAPGATRELSSGVETGKAPRIAPKRWIALFAGLAILAGAGAFTAWWLSRPQKIEIFVVAPVTVERVLAVVGRVRPRDLLDVKSPNAGQVIRMLHDDGDVVTAGEPLAIIRAAVEQAQARADVAREQAARAEETRAQLAFARTGGLAEKGFATQAALEEAQATLDTARANLSAATATTSAAAERAKEFIVRAPMDGVVLVRPVASGQVVSTTTTLFQLGSTQGIEIRAEVDEAYADSLRPGMTARAVLSGSETRFSARVSEVSPQVDAATGGRLVKLVPLDADHLAPGRSVDVTIVVDRTQNAIVIPRQSVINAAATAEVYVLDAGDVAQLRRISITHWPSLNAIVDSGLAAGDRVVLSPAKIRPAERVRPVVTPPAAND
jgi:RND family efflux transporter MFP subunit